jgi:hypothetical protein
VSNKTTKGRRLGTIAASVRKECDCCIDDKRKACLFIRMRTPVQKNIYICHDCIIDLLERELDGREDGSVLPELLAETEATATATVGDDDKDRVTDSGTTDTGAGTGTRGKRRSNPSVKKGAKRGRKKSKVC